MYQHSNQTISFNLQNNNTGKQMKTMKVLNFGSQFRHTFRLQKNKNEKQK